MATRLLTISEASKRDLVRLYRADPARIDVAYPAVDARFRPARPGEVGRVRQKYGLAERYVLHLGTIKPRKNLPRLIHAFSRADLPSDTQLALGGMTTFGGGEVERAVVESGIGERLRRLGYVDDTDLPALYSGAACVAIVSLYEGFGLPALEAMACGAPLVIGNRGSLPEIGANAAIVVDPLDKAAIASALTTVVGDPSLAEQLRERGPLRAQQFDWASAARVTRQALQSSVGTRTPSGRRSAAS
jgi:glycosyltransferase involved in cell wall biosynthesis